MMGRFAHLVDSPASMEGFRALYHIPQGVSWWYYSPSEWVTHRNEGEVIIPMIAFIEWGIRLPMGNVTRNYLITHRLCPHQCASNLFRILANRVKPHLARRRLDVRVHLLADSGYYLKFRSSVIRLVSCLPKSNKGMKDDYPITSSKWHHSLHCLTREGEPGGVS